MASEERADTVEESGFLEKSTDYKNSLVEYEDAKNQLDAFNLGLVNQGIDIKAKPILLGDINQKLAALDDKSKVSAMFLANNANTALAKMTALKGLYDEAKKTVQDSAPTWYEVQKLALDAFAQKNKLDEQQKSELADKDTAEFNKMKEGMLKITTPEELAKYESDILSGKAKGIIQTDVYGQKWFKDTTAKMSVLEEYAGKAAIDAMYDSGKIKDSKIVDIGGTQYLQITYPDGSTTFTKPNIPEDNKNAEKATTQLDLVQKSLDNAKALYKASGNVGILGKAGRWFTGTDKYTT